jgi:hypothetical protein
MTQNSNAANNPDGPKPAENAAPSEGTKDWLKKLTAKWGKLQIVLRGSGAAHFKSDSN